MAEKFKIKISIADRVYPLSILPEQEEGLRRAAKNINLVIKKYEQNYAVRDKQDVLAMCALQFAAEIEQKKLSNSSQDSALNNKLEELNDLLNTNLN
ncbi:MAG: cell division protein ZapA [Bacteroidota bacterium]